MGTYLNPGNQSFLSQVEDIYIDKTMLLRETNARLNRPSSKFLCISRPRRFGKSIAGNMLVAYYSKGADSKELFSPYKIAQTEHFEKYLNKFNVIKIDLNAMHAEWKELASSENHDSFVTYIGKEVCAEFRSEFSDVVFGEYQSISNYIQKVWSQKKETFIIIIDEYDVLIREQASEEQLDSYRNFLITLFKNSALEPAISLAYITGILPIMKDKIQSKLNTFTPYTMLDADDFAEFTGFTSDEVASLCEKYHCDFEECKSWYDGYRLCDFEIYSPVSLIKSLPKGKFKSYWSGTSTYQVVAEKINMNFAGTKEDVIAMLGGAKVDVSVDHYDNTMTGFRNKDDIFTFLIHLGYLAYDEDEEMCYIPNREIHEEWIRAVEDDDDYSVTNEIIKASKNLLRETIAGNAELVAASLDKSHIHVASNRSYNNEYCLQSAIYLAYIYALNGYIITKEMPSGKGVADITYIPFDKSRPALIVELKHNKSAQNALTQIKEKRYFESLANWTGDILFVGVNYDEQTKAHECKIERFVKE